MTDPDKEWLERLHSNRNSPPAFTGSYEFEVVFELLGQKQARKMRANYEFTPEGQYFDLAKGEIVEGHGRSAISLSILAVPADENEPYDDPDGASDDDTETVEDPRWIDFDSFHEGVLNYKIWDAIYEAVMEQCKAENDARLVAAGLEASTNWG
jgi:hypothetical protein